MQISEQTPEALLILEDGTLWRGYAVGSIGTVTGEICFNTGMTGYQEIYTDPSYYGQIVINTCAHIGNYGVIAEDDESAKPQIRGMVCNAFSNQYSRKRADDSLQAYLKKHGVVAIAGIDTRALVSHIRQKGAMNALISSECNDLTQLKTYLEQTPSMQGLELSSQVTTKQPYILGEGNRGPKIAALDLGVKRNILQHLTRRRAVVKVFPAKTSFEEIAAWQPDAYFISNGPGDPAAMPYAVRTLQQMLRTNLPLFGICLGHQLLALASGISTHKMHNGHRGLNHPVKNLISGRSEVTSQNHGFGINRSDVEKNPVIQVTHINLNDGSIEGIRRTDCPAFSVQYHPEASPGPHDATYLFDEFMQLIEQRKLYGISYE